MAGVIGPPTGQTESPPLVVHVVHHLGVGGLENGVVNLINLMPPERYRHAIVCLKGYSDFYKRINRKDVEIVALNKRDGNDFGLYVSLFRIFRRMQPAIVHTRNLATMEGQLVASAAGVREQVHGEHGRDVFDLHGKNRKYNVLRKVICPFIDHFITVSKDLQGWLIETVGARPSSIRQIYNGVDSVRFYPRTASVRPDIGPAGFIPDNAFVIGSVGRIVAVKDYPTLIRAFLKFFRSAPEVRERLRLILVGEGESRHACMEMLRGTGAENAVWFTGERADIADLMRMMDVFILPSLGEGISNTILEAMSGGLPVIATRVGGNNELVRDGVTGTLVAAGDADAIAETIEWYYRNPQICIEQGQAARQQVEENFSMAAMIDGYLAVYDKVLAGSH